MHHTRDVNREKHTKSSSVIDFEFQESFHKKWSIIVRGTWTDWYSRLIQSQRGILFIIKSWSNFHKSFVNFSLENCIATFSSKFQNQNFHCSCKTKEEIDIIKQPINWLQSNKEDTLFSFNHFSLIDQQKSWPREKREERKQSFFSKREERRFARKLSHRDTFDKQRSTLYFHISISVTHNTSRRKKEHKQGRKTRIRSLDHFWFFEGVTWSIKYYMESTIKLRVQVSLAKGKYETFMKEISNIYIHEIIIMQSFSKLVCLLRNVIPLCISSPSFYMHFF